MADPYSDLGSQDTNLQERIADAMEARCLEPAQISIRKAYLKDLGLPDDAKAIEIGSGKRHFAARAPRSGTGRVLLSGGCWR